MLWLFSFKGAVRRGPYALASLGVLIVQYLGIAVTFATFGTPIDLDWQFLLAPMRTTLALQGHDAVALAIFLLLLVAAWAQAALAFRRAVDAGTSGWLAAPAVAPVLQLPAILILCCLRSWSGSLPVTTGGAKALGRIEWTVPAQGALVGMGLTLFAVAASALIFGTYGFGMFVLSPVLIGMSTGYLANFRHDVGRGATAGVVTVAMALGGIALVVAALEGVLCILMAAPLALIAAQIGGMFGRMAAVNTRHSVKHSFVAVAMLPLVFASETLVPLSANINSEQAIEIAAPIEIVWETLTAMDVIESRPALPFRLGLAYPISGRIEGEGVGATRFGTFSTGTALERVTEWVEARKLAFVVLDEPPSMIELSPYKNVHAPHVKGFFRTIHTSFELAPLPDGRTCVIENTSHELELEPVFYWRPMARWVIHANNARVLEHIRNKAERAASRSAALKD